MLRMLAGSFIARLLHCTVGHAKNLTAAVHARWMASTFLWAVLQESSLLENMVQHL